MVVGPIVKGSKVAGRFKDFMPLLRSSATGGLFSGGLTTLFTGDPLAGLAVGAADTLGSAVLATGIGALGGASGTRKILGKDIKFAGGKKYTFSETDDLNPLLKKVKDAGKATPAGLEPSKEAVMNTIAPYVQSKGYYSPSGPQLAGMYAGSIAAPFAIEPMFYPKPQGGIVQQQLVQRYGTSELLTNPKYATDDRRIRGELENEITNSQGNTLSTGTLYQLPLAGNPMRGM
tara:strand:+ start:37 stop:732 length:696 start_codon:yes stop_codon:yes gene_type:complete